MPSTPANEIPIEEPRVDVPKVRRCLRCETTFHSQWAGERICPGARVLTHGEMVLLSVLVLQAPVTRQLSASRLLTLSSFLAAYFASLAAFCAPVKLRLHLLYGALLLFVLQFELPFLPLLLQAVPPFQPFALLSGLPSFRRCFPFRLPFLESWIPWAGLRFNSC